MKMSQENYEKFKEFYEYTVEHANDNDIEIIFMAIVAASKKMAELQKNDEMLVAHKKPTIKH